MDIWHKVGRVVRISNLGTLIFFLLNMSLFVGAFASDAYSWQDIAILVGIYIATVLLSLSPIGEMLLALMAGAREIKRKDIKIRLIPLLEVVMGDAQRKSLSSIRTVNLKIVRDKAPNAFAIGRKTICVTEGVLTLSDDEIMAIFAHELGHLTYKHSSIQLLIGGGNLFISGMLFIIKLMCWFIMTIFGLIALSTRRVIPGILITIVGGITAFSMWLWTKFCMLFLMWSMRQNEYVADEFAFRLGYGDILARVLDNQLCSNPENGFLKALFSTHPSSDDRIARLQNLGSCYSRY